MLSEVVWLQGLVDGGGGLLRSGGFATAQPECGAAWVWGKVRHRARCTRGQRLNTSNETTVSAI